MEVVLRAAVDQTSVNGVTTSTEDTPNRETVMDWLHTLEKETMLDAVNDILALVAMTVLDRDGSRTICIDFMNNPFHGCPDDEDEFRRMSARDGTTKCHRYCTAFVLAQGKPLTLAVEPVDGKDSKADAVERVLARVENYPFEIELLLADSGFFNERVIRRSREIAATVVHVPKKGDRMKEKLDVHKSYMTTYRMYKDSERELRVPLAVSVSYQNGDRNKHGEVVRGYVACGVTDHTAKQVERIYRKRSGIETTYRLIRQARGVTTTRDPVVRFAFMLVAAILENLWLVLRWAVVARPQRGGRDLPEEFTFSVFCDWIRRELEEQLERRWKIKMNETGIPPSYQTTEG